MTQIVCGLEVILTFGLYNNQEIVNRLAAANRVKDWVTLS